MKFCFLFFCFFPWTVTFGQVNTPPVQSDALTKSISFGWSNPVSFIGNINDVINENMTELEDRRREECKYDIIEDVESSYEDMDIDEEKYNEIDFTQLNNYNKLKIN